VFVVKFVFRCHFFWSVSLYFIRIWFLFGGVLIFVVGFCGQFVFWNLFMRVFVGGGVWVGLFFILLFWVNCVVGLFLNVFFVVVVLWVLFLSGWYCSFCSHCYSGWFVVSGWVYLSLVFGIRVGGRFMWFRFLVIVFFVCLFWVVG